MPGIVLKSRTACTGVVLAGGRSRRMGGQTKAFLDIGGKPLLQHAIDRLRPQVDRLLLSVERESGEYAPFGLAQVADPVQGHGGPLGGLLAALKETVRGNDEWLLLAPCDAPFLPPDLAERLLACARTHQSPGALVRLMGEAQPTFSAWHARLLPALEHAVTEQNMAGFKQFLAEVPLAMLDWPVEEKIAFFNINDEAALEEARRIYHEEHNSC